MILFIDTCFTSSNIDIVKFSNKNFTILSSLSSTSKKQPLLRMLDESLGVAGVKVSDISHIVFNNGPGSFNGIRVGMSFIRGLLDANPLLKYSAFNSLEIGYQEYLQSGSGETIIAIPALGKFYQAPIAAFQSGSVEEHVTFDDLNSNHQCYIYQPQPSNINLIKAYQSCQTVSTEFTPFYLRGAV